MGSANSTSVGWYSGATGSVRSHSGGSTAGGCSDMAEAEAEGEGFVRGGGVAFGRRRFGGIGLAAAAAAAGLAWVLAADAACCCFGGSERREEREMVGKTR